ncbi:MAG: ABC transporter permease subunit [Pirellulales bacterium]
MNRALWEKAIRDALPLLVSLLALLFLFHWLFVWLTSQISLPAMHEFLLNALPKDWEKLSGVPFKEVATPAGRLALAWVDPLVLFAATIWAISRGSDVVSGELGRGSLELLLAQPIRRSSLVSIQAAVCTLGAALLALAGWLGNWVGIRTVSSVAEVDPRLFAPAAINLFGYIVFLSGVTALASAFDRQRWRTIGLAGGFFALQMLLQVVARMSSSLSWVGWLTFLSAYEPQVLVARTDGAWLQLAIYNAWLLGLGGLGWGAASFVFSRRDIPAPV